MRHRLRIGPVWGPCGSAAQHDWVPQVCQVQMLVDVALCTVERDRAEHPNSELYCTSFHEVLSAARLWRSEANV